MLLEPSILINLTCLNHNEVPCTQMLDQHSQKDSHKIYEMIYLLGFTSYLTAVVESFHLHALTHRNNYYIKSP